MKISDAAKKPVGLNLRAVCEKYDIPFHNIAENQDAFDLETGAGPRAARYSCDADFLEAERLFQSATMLPSANSIM